MTTLVGLVCATGSVLFDLASYWKQISKTLRTKRSSQVSTQAYMMKLAHYTCSVIALSLYANYAGLVMELCAFTACIVCFYLVIKFKPKGWTLL